MQQLLKSLAVGVAAGAVTYAASIYTLGYTNAFAMPQGFPIILWDTAVVFGLGAMLVALLVHYISLRTFSGNVLPAFAGFAVTVVLSMAVTGQLALGYRPVAAWLIGALLASATYSRLRSNNSFKPKPLRGSA